MSIRAVPQIVKQQAVSDSAVRYGYVAYHDIVLGSDYQVQPSTSPYHKLIPCRELIPFSDMPVTEINIEKYGLGGTFNAQKISPVTQRMKSAKDCITEIVNSYQAWAFVELVPLSGFDTDRAFRIFQTIQPFPYLLKDMEFELDGAEDRIEATAPYTVTYQGESYEVEPLNDEDKDIALQVLRIIKHSAKYAVEIGQKRLDDTIESMANRFSGGDGKRSADPHDKYLSKDLGVELPKKFSSNQQQQPSMVQTTERDAYIALRLREMELKERELAIREMELGLRQKPEPQVATLPRTCAGTKADGEPCKAYAITDSDFCVSHRQ